MDPCWELRSALVGAVQGEIDLLIDGAREEARPLNEAYQESLEGRQPYYDAWQEALNRKQPLYDAFNRALEGQQPYFDAFNRAMEGQRPYTEALLQELNQGIYNGSAQAAADRYQREVINPAMAASDEYRRKVVDPALRALEEYDAEVVNPAFQALEQYEAEQVAPLAHAINEHSDAVQKAVEPYYDRIDQVGTMLCGDVSAAAAEFGIVVTPPPLPPAFYDFDSWGPIPPEPQPIPPIHDWAPAEEPKPLPPFGDWASPEEPQPDRPYFEPEPVPEPQPGPEPEPSYPSGPQMHGPDDDFPPEVWSYILDQPRPPVEEPIDEEQLRDLLSRSDANLKQDQGSQRLGGEDTVDADGPSVIDPVEEPSDDPSSLPSQYFNELKCPACQGAKTILGRCPVCKGRTGFDWGKVDTGSEGGISGDPEQFKCQRCGGTGQVSRVCETCNGAGTIRVLKPDYDLR